MIYDVTGAAIAQDNANNGGIGLHEVPENQGQLNAVKRARQLTDLRWTPPDDVIRIQFANPRGKTATETYAREDLQDRFLGGVTYTGIPYSGKNDVGIEVALSTFATAAATPGSKLITHATYGAAEGASGILSAAWYGSTCVNLVGYALDVLYATSNAWPNLYGMTYRYKVVNNGVRGDLDHDLKLGDVLQVSGHVALITDIVRDAHGAVTWVEVSEATKVGTRNPARTGGPDGGKCQRVMWSVDDFCRFFGGMSVYRYKYLNTVRYTPSPYVPMPDEGTPYAPTDLAVVPELGDNALIDVSDGAKTVKLLIGGTYYTHAVVRKNGDIVRETALDGASEISLTCAQEEAEYEVYLYRAVPGESKLNVSASCFWYTLGGIEPSLSIEDGTASFSLLLASDAFTPHGILWGTNDGFSYSRYRRIFPEYVSKAAEGGGVKYTFSIDVNAGYTPTRYRFYLKSEQYGGCFREINI